MSIGFNNYNFFLLWDFYFPTSTPTGSKESNILQKSRAFNIRVLIRSLLLRL